MPPQTMVNPARLEELVRPIKAAIEEQDFELTGDIVDRAYLATFRKGDAEVECILELKGDVENPSYSEIADVSLEVKLRQGPNVTLVYDSGDSSSNITTAGIISNLLNGEGKLSEWPDPESPYARMAVGGLKRMLADVLGQIPITYAVTTSKPISIQEFVSKLWKAYDPSSVVPYLLSRSEIPLGGEIRDATHVATPKATYNEVYFSVMPLSAGTAGGSQKFEVLVTPKRYAPELLDHHRLHLAIKETAKALN